MRHAKASFSSRQSNGESLFVLSTNLAQAKLQLLLGRDNALANLQKRQSEEMAAEVAHNVPQHVSLWVLTLTRDFL